MAKVVCRISKLKSPQKIGQASHHNHRLNGEAERDHINPNPSEKNRTLIGSENILNDVNTRLETAEKTADGTFRSNAVLAVEMILSASPEYFTSKQKTDEWIKANEDFLRQEYGPNCVSAVVHLDEQTPHIHAIIVPIDEKNKLNCRGIFGGKEKLKALQDKTAKAVKHLGIQRGIPKDVTDVKHKTTKQWRKEQKQIDQDVKSLREAIDKIPTMPANVTGLVKAKSADEYYKNEAKKQMRKSTAPTLQRYASENSKLKKEALEIAKEKEETEKKLKEQERLAYEARAENYRLRNIMKNDVDELVQEAHRAGYKKAQKEQADLKRQEEARLAEQARLEAQKNKVTTGGLKPSPIKR